MSNHIFIMQPFGCMSRAGLKIFRSPRMRSLAESFQLSTFALFAGMIHFTDFQQSLEIAPNILTKWLESFVKEGLMTTSKVNQSIWSTFSPPKGLDFKRVIIALTKWGDKWTAPDGPPIIYQHEGWKAD